MAGRRPPTIAISGPPGSGKTTYARLIARDFSLRHHSAGSIFRRLAEKLNMSLEELNELASRDPSIDVEIDRMTYQLGVKGGVVVEGHLVAWVLNDVADSRIYVTADPMVRARRIAEREGRGLDDVVVETFMRQELHAERFRRYYGFDLRDLSIFDLVIDTTRLTIEQAYRIIHEHLCATLLNLGYGKPYTATCRE